MPVYSVTDLDHNKTVSVYSLPSCDFPSLFDVLKDFAEENELEDCVLSVRDYVDDERCEHEVSPAITAYNEKLKKAEKEKKSTKRFKKPALKPVDPNTGSAWVISFNWTVHKLDKAKQIDYKFYDEGWPGSITISKTPSVLCPTEIVITTINRPSNLQEKFKDAILAADVPPSKI